MTLILTAAPRPQALNMVPDEASPLAPGAPPPWISPHCRKCKIPVERFTIDWVSSPYYLPIQFECHGQTSGMRIPHDEVLFKRKNGGIIWVF